MTTVVISGDGFRMNEADLSGVTDYLFQDLTATEARYYDDADNYQSFLGTGFTYDPAGNLTGGTMTKAITFESGAENVRFSNFSVDAGDFGSAVLTNDAGTLWSLLLSGADVIKGGADHDQLLGNAGNDRIYGNGGNDLIFGEVGADRLFGGDGSDVLIGGLGADYIDGGPGSDMMGGGPGLDSFVFSEAPVAMVVDRILDFQPEHDSILLERADFAGVGAVGALAAARFYVGAAAHDASDRIIYNDATGALIFDSDGTGANPGIQFAIMGAGLAVTVADFTIF